jgi:hypothetical protein
MLSKCSVHELHPNQLALNFYLFFCSAGNQAQNLVHARQGSKWTTPQASTPFFWVVLGFELSAPYLLGRHSMT